MNIHNIPKIFYGSVVDKLTFLEFLLWIVATDTPRWLFWKSFAEH